MTTATADAAKSPLAAALGRVSSGLYILTMTRDGQDAAMLCSWVMQCGFEPPQVSVAIQLDRPLVKWMTHGAKLVLNVIPEGDKSLLKHFGKGFEPGEPPFEGVDIERDLAAGPVLKVAAAWLECEVQTATQTSTDLTDHLLVVTKVVGGATLSDAKPAVHLRKSGMNY